MATLEELHPCVPATERGQGILVSGDQKSCSIIYCNGRSVVIRSLENPLKADIYGEHAYPVTVARFSPNGEWVASADVSGKVRIWAAGAGHVLKYEYQSLSGRIDDLQWSADGERIVVCGDGKGKSFVRAFMWDSGNTVGSFDGHSKRVLSCSFKPNRPFRIATCGEDFLINYYEGPPFRFKASHRDHSNFVNCIRFSPDGTKFISVGSDKKGFIYDGKTGDKIGELSADAGHVGSIYAACWSPDGTKMFTASADKTAKIWDMSDTSSPKVSTTFLVSDNGTIEDMQVGCLWLKDYLISISLNGQMIYWSTENAATPQRVLAGHMKSITAITLALTDHGTDIYSGSYDGVIIKWRLGMGFLCRYEMKELKNITSLLAVGSELLTCGLNKFQRAALDCEKFKVDAIDLGEPCKDLDGNTDIAIVCTETGIHLLKGSNILSKTSINYVATAAALSPDGSEAVAGAIDGKLYVYSVNGDTLAQTAVLERHRGPVTAVRYSPDGSMYASGDQNREAVVWDRISREVRMKNMLYHTARIKCIAWSPDSSKVATGSIDTCIYVYTVEKPASARITIKGAHLGGVSALAFKDSHTLISGGDDACVRVWNIS